MCSGLGIGKEFPKAVVATKRNKCGVVSLNKKYPKNED